MRRATKHYFIPHEHNNFRSKLLHHSSVVVLILFLFLTSVSFNFVQHQKPEVLGIAYSINQQELLEDTNNARREQGLEPLTLNDSLISAANAKAQHMFAHNYWAHFAPDGTTPWQFIKSSGYSYVFAGENLAKGFTDSQSIVNAWLNSPSHRENLLSDKYKEIGFAVAEGSIDGVETVLVVQMFGSQDVPVITEPKIAAAPTEVPILSTIGVTVTPTVIPASSTATIKDPKITYQPVTETRVAKVQPPITPSFLNISAENNPLLNLENLTRIVPIIIVLALLLALILDFVIIKRRNIPRIVGHNLDHIMILGMFLLLLLLQRFGSIL